MNVHVCDKVVGVPPLCIAHPSMNTDSSSCMLEMRDEDDIEDSDEEYVDSGWSSTR
jgi:hypothetical protein